MEAFPTSPEDQAALLARYDVLLAAHEALHERIIEGIPEQLLLAVANQLQLVRRGQIDLKDDFEMELLVEYALYDEQADGKLPLDILGQPLVAEGSLAEQILKAMAAARFAIFRIKEVVPGVGLELWDYVRSEPVPMVLKEPDEALAKGAYFMGRVMEIEDVRMLAGSIYPVPEELAASLVEALRQKDVEDLSTKELPTPSWVDPALMEALIETKWAASRTPVTSTKVGRNDPCPCGSGKKSKKCCGAV